jgi:hypothetical protein
MNKSLAVLVLAKCSLLGAGALLLMNPFAPDKLHNYLSSFPLALAGLGYIVLQIQLRPPRRILLKRLLLAGAFLLWAAVQLLPSGRLAVFLGDVVIAAYVVDLFWMMQDQRETPVNGHEFQPAKRQGSRN